MNKLSIIKKILYIIIQCTWGSIQSLAGLIICLGSGTCRRYWYRGAIATEWESEYGLSLGMFIFVSASLHGTVAKERGMEQMLIHEYGHTIQSLLLGPLYLIVIGIPSFVWCNLPKFRRLRKEKQISYYAFYPEKWANFCGEKVTGRRLWRK